MQPEQPKTLTHPYAPPLDKLLTYTNSQEDEDPLPDISYVEQFGIGPEHIPELLRMAADEYLLSDDSNDFESTAPLHAVKALGELHAEETIEPLLALYDNAVMKNNEWICELLMDVLTTFGSAALPLLEQFLLDPSHSDFAKNYISEIIGRIVDRYPETRPECIAILTRSLQNYEANDPDLNAFLVGELLNMKALEAAPLIQEALASDYVNEFWCGDWDEAQYKLGLKERPPAKDRETILRERLGPRTTPMPFQSTLDTANTPVHNKPAKKAPTNKKAKSKMAKASKKANRRKR